MPKTYTALTVANATAGNAILASDHSAAFTNINNLRVPPAARIELTSNVAVANNSHTDFTGFTSTNASEVVDTDGMVTLSGTASAITVQTTGLYAVSAQAIFATNGTGNRLLRIVRSRSGTLVSIASALQPSQSVSPASLSVSGIGSFEAGDLIRFMVLQSSGGSLNLQAVDTDEQYGRTHLAAAWIGQVS